MLTNKRIKLNAPLPRSGVSAERRIIFPLCAPTPANPRALVFSGQRESWRIASHKPLGLKTENLLLN